MFLAMKVKNKFCVDSWLEQWMPKALTLAVDFVVFVPLTLMVVLYSRMISTLWFKGNEDDQLNHRQMVRAKAI